MSKIKIKYMFRSANEMDRGYILKTWLRTFRDELKNQGLSDHQYYAQTEPLFKSILDQFGAIVAVNPDAPDQIYAFAIAGYIPSEKDWVLFWIQTKSLYFNLGIGTALFKLVKANKEYAFCPFMKNKMKKYINKCQLIEAPYMLPKLLEAAKSANNELFKE